MIRRLRSLALGLAPALLLVACTGATAGLTASASPASSSPIASGSAAPSVSAAPRASASPAPAASSTGTPGTVGGNTGATPLPIDGPGGSGVIIPAPSPVDVTPVANLKQLHDVRAADLKVTMQGTHLVATIIWWSGPPPCSALAEVKIAQTGMTFTLTVREGAQQLGIACPALAMEKQTAVDLGQVAPGTYTVGATGVDSTVTIILDAAN